jgi:uncharacterized membrane protein YcaP (DUF421 family)
MQVLDVRCNLGQVFRRFSGRRLIPPTKAFAVLLAILIGSLARAG